MEVSFVEGFVGDVCFLEMEIILDRGVLVFVADKMEMEEEEDDGEVL